MLITLITYPDGMFSFCTDQSWIGHLYYYNAATKASTYTRPQTPQAHSLVDPAASGSNPQPAFPYLQSGFEPSETISSGPNVFAPEVFQSRATGSPFRVRGDSRGRHGQYQRAQPIDRPKSKHMIPGCESWVLVKTRLGRRFVYNSEQNQSLWRPPPEVMRGVAEYDRQARETCQIPEQVCNADAVNQSILKVDAKIRAAASRPTSSVPTAAHEQLNSDEEYEEVEVTDEENCSSPKRRRVEGENVDQPFEFNEDDIAYQFQAMGQNYGLEPGEYDDGEISDLEDGLTGLPLTKDDSRALFRDMLDDYHISPYTPWEALIECGQIVEDDRYTVLPNMRSRKEIWGEWGRDKIQCMKEQREKEGKKDPKAHYFAFLQARASPKLYWPEFRRKYQKEPEMRNTKLTDKEREKWYREYINRLKYPENTLKVELVKVLKSIPLHSLNRSTTLDSLPSTLLTDLHFIALRASIRDPLVEAHISTLPPAPTDPFMPPEEEELKAKVKQERERRERALVERQRQVVEEKRRQQGVLRYSKGMLREGEQEVERAMKVGRDGLLGYIGTEKALAIESQRGAECSNL